VSAALCAIPYSVADAGLIETLPEDVRRALSRAFRAGALSALLGVEAGGGVSPADATKALRDALREARHELESAEWAVDEAERAFKALTGVEP